MAKQKLLEVYTLTDLLNIENRTGQRRLHCCCIRAKHKLISVAIDIKKHTTVFFLRTFAPSVQFGLVVW